MPTRTIEEQLVSYLSDAHAIEVQALAQLRRAPDVAGEPSLAAVLRGHEAETERHEALVRELLEERGAAPSRVKDAVMGAGGIGFVLFARAQPDTPGKLAAHAFSYEHLELAAYELLEQVARLAGDERVARVAREIRDEEAAMAERVAGCFDATTAASLATERERTAADQLTDYLADAHALETQAAELLEKAAAIGGDRRLRRAYENHLSQTHGHRAAIDRLLDERGASTSGLEDAAMRVGAINWGLFFQAQPDTPGKLAAFAYAFEHLEIAGYEQLLRVARAAGDGEAVAVAERILDEERSTAATFAAGFDVAVRGSLDVVGVGPQPGG